VIGGWLGGSASCGNRIQGLLVSGQCLGRRLGVRFLTLASPGLRRSYCELWLGVREKYAERSLGGIQTSVATKKKPPVMTECEVKVRGRWLPRTLYEALTERGDDAVQVLALPGAGAERIE
jgi:hypothetical protein